MRLSITAKVFSGFTVVIITFCLVSGYSVLKLRSIQGNLRLIKESYLQTSLLLGEVAGDLKSFDVVLGQRDRTLLAKSVGVVRRLYPFPTVVAGNLNRAVVMAKRNVEGARPPYREYLDELLERLERLRARSVEMESMSERFFSLVDQGDFDTADEERIRLKAINREILREVRHLSIELRHEVSRSVLRAERLEMESMWAVLILSAVAFWASIAVLVVVQHTLRPIRRLTEAVKRISTEGHLRRVDIASKDEIGVLAEEFNRMVESLQERDRQLLRSERLATIGKMAAQVAHEVRNPLSSIGLNAELLAEELEEVEGTTDEARATLETIHAEVERLGEVTESYLSLARLPSPAMEEEQVDELLEDLLEFVQPELKKKNVVLRRQLHGSLPPVKMDENQIRQALLNLIRNGCDAMEQVASHGEKVLQVETRMEGEERIVIHVGDNGDGIAPENLHRIFEPFFSTKSKGTGLGLALAQHIVEEHGGEIQVFSKEGEGTSFELCLPVLSGDLVCES